MTIDFKELRRLIFFIFKLSLETSNEILLDYDLGKLADAVTLGAFTFNQVDHTMGKLNFRQVMKYINKTSEQEMRH